MLTFDLLYCATKMVGVKTWAADSYRSFQIPSFAIFEQRGLGQALLPFYFSVLSSVKWTLS